MTAVGSIRQNIKEMLATGATFPLLGTTVPFHVLDRARSDGSSKIDTSKPAAGARRRIDPMEP